MLCRLLVICSIAPASVPGYAGETYRLTEQYLAGITNDYGNYTRRRIEHWQQLIKSSGKLTEQEKLEVVNDFFNNMRFISDAEQWGKEDYWETPLEMLVVNGGDCEDFSIAKYFSLREMGVSNEKLRLTYVKAVELNQAHMVLTYYSTPDADPLVLDNLDRKIVTASLRHDLLPVYSFNADGLWLAKAHGTDQHVGSSSRLSQWNAVVARIYHEQLAAAR